MQLPEGVGTPTSPQGNGQGARSAPAGEQLETVIPSLGSSDFTRCFAIDWGQWLPLVGIQRTVVRWMLGNPWSALAMIQQDIPASVFAPVDLVLVANASGDGSTVIDAVPASLMGIEPQPAREVAALALDRK